MTHIKAYSNRGDNAVTDDFDYNDDDKNSDNYHNLLSAITKYIMHFQNIQVYARTL